MSPPRVLKALAGAVLCATPAPCQHAAPAAPPRRVAADPYGSLPRPFAVGDDHDSLDVERSTGASLCWIETSHLRLGVDLHPIKAPAGSTARAALEAELARLRKVLPKVPAKVAVLDRWLRAHLLAQRLEDLCAETLALLGLDDARFAKSEAPFLGMRSRLLVLVFADTGGLARYWKGCVDLPIATPKRHWFKSADCLMFATSENALGEHADDDKALHAHVVHYVAQNLILGIGGVTDELPTWIQVGYGQWLARRISCELAPGDGERSVEDVVLGLAQTGRLPRAEPQMTTFDFAEVKTSDFPALWSRMDFLSSHGRDKLGEFLARMMRMKQRAGLLSPVPREIVLERQEKALGEAFGFGVAEFDERWRAFVLRAYRSR